MNFFLIATTLISIVSNNKFTETRGIKFLIVSSLNKYSFQSGEVSSQRSIFASFLSIGLNYQRYSLALVLSFQNSYSAIYLVRNHQRYLFYKIYKTIPNTLQLNNLTNTRISTNTHFQSQFAIRRTRRKEKVSKRKAVTSINVANFHLHKRLSQRNEKDQQETKRRSERKRRESYKKEDREEVSGNFSKSF